MGASPGHYFENDKIVWGDYSGRKIIKGHFLFKNESYPFITL